MQPFRTVKGEGPGVAGPVEEGNRKKGTILGYLELSSP